MRAGPGPAQEAQVTDTTRPPSPVDELSDRFWEGVLELSPTTATTYGDERWDDRLGEPGPEGRAKARALLERTLGEATAIEEEGLSVEERITRDMLRVACEIRLEEDEHRFDLYGAVDQMAGPQQVLPQVVVAQVMFAQGLLLNLAPSDEHGVAAFHDSTKALISDGQERYQAVQQDQHKSCDDRAQQRS